MDHSFWDTLSGEMGHFVHKVEVLHEQRASWTGRQGVLVVIEWGSVRSRDDGLFHEFTLLILQLNLLSLDLSEKFLIQAFNLLTSLF